MIRPKPSVATVERAIRTILRDKKSYNTSLNYAVNYCVCALGMSETSLETQCLYILGNITKWRHPEAKEIRNILKDFAGVKR